MKNSIKNIITIAVLALITFSFATLEEIKKDVNIADSKVVWKGYKVTGSHDGEILLKSGHLVFNKNQLKGGSFVIDMSSIIVTDLQGEYKQKLEGHLKSNDFFGVEKYPTASLDITNVSPKDNNTYQVIGNLTIKGKTEPVTFMMTVNGSKAKVILKVDRTKYDVKYGSASFFEGLKDKAIYDEFDLVADLEF